MTIAMQQNHYLVPPHPGGLKKDLELQTVASTAEDAEYWFVDVKDRLLDVNSWNKYCPDISAEFRLTDGRGMGVGRHARRGDLIRMDIAGNNAVQTGGFDWMRIEAIEYDDYPDLSMETFAVRVRTEKNPLDKNGRKNVDTPDNDATFTFVVERRASKLFTSYHSRIDADNVDDAAPNAWFGLPDTEWSALIKNIMG